MSAILDSNSAERAQMLQESVSSKLPAEANDNSNTSTVSFPQGSSLADANYAAAIPATSHIKVDSAFFVTAARMLRDELPLLCDDRIKGVADLSASESSTLLTASALDSLLGALSEYLCMPAYALTVARYFKPVLMEIFARATESKVMTSCDSPSTMMPEPSSEVKNHHAAISLEEQALAFARVVTVYPRVLPLIISFLSQSRSLFENVALAGSELAFNGNSSQQVNGRKRRKEMMDSDNIKIDEERPIFASSSRPVHSSASQAYRAHPRRLREIAEAARRLVAIDPETFSSMWNWGPFYSLVRAADAMTRFYARQALAIKAGFTLSENSNEDSGRQSTLSSKLSLQERYTHRTHSSDSESRCLIEKSLSFVHVHRSVDPSSPNMQRVDEYSRKSESIFRQNLVCGVAMRESLLNICGVTLERSSLSTDSESILDQDDIMVATQTVRSNMALLANALCQKDPILLSGAQGSGKTTMLRHLAHHLGLPPLVELHIDDQMDIKTLLGTYVCSDLPGEFRWQPGVLTQAVLAGRWVVIDDIDRAPFDVLSSLTDLIENRTIVLPGAGDIIRAKKTFRLFATRSELTHKHVLERNKSSDTANDVTDSGEASATAVAAASFGGNAQISKFLDGYWITVRIAQQTAHELASILSVRYRVKKPVAAKMVQTFDHVRRASQQLRGLRRVPTLRDLLLWCHRVRQFGHLLERNKEGQPKYNGNEIDNLSGVDSLSSQNRIDDTFLTQQEREAIVIEALDCFCKAAPLKDDRERLVRIVAASWDVDADGLVKHMKSHRPQIEALEEEYEDSEIDDTVSKIASHQALVSIGRITLPILRRTELAAGNLDGPGSTAKFAYTGAALRLLETLSGCVAMVAPVLLVGETGCGKTTVVQHLAQCVGQKLVVQNLNIQSDSTDLLGGFKPVDISTVARPLVDKFIKLFESSFPSNANRAFVIAIQKACAGKKWKKLEKGVLKAVSMAKSQTNKDSSNSKQATTLDRSESNISSSKRSRSSTDSGSLSIDIAAWEALEVEVHRFTKKRSQIEQSFVFAFVEGALVRALREGHWVLLDEINLASPETLQRISCLLDNGSQGTIVLTENGEIKPVARHPNFRLFAAMNPATDVGKRDLPPALRSRFSEFYVDEITDPADLAIVVEKYMRGVERPPIDAIVQCYIAARGLAERSLFDGAGQSPRYSLRTLCRALEASRIFYDRRYRLERSLYEGHSMSFLTQLEPVSAKKLRRLIVSSFCSKMKKKDLRKAPGKPGGKNRGGSNDNWIVCQRVWLPKGPLESVNDAEPNADTGRVNYVMTESVKENLYRLCCCVAVKKYPVLLQGPTSSGKTTMVMYLARLTGHRCVRINNHEHTDLQEYMGSYVSDSSGRLVFKEGLLVEAVRNGYWIVLDELNLAPSEVLEALNRLLDDNRELFIPETQEVVRPHPSFMIFGTQNPPGIYGGRKVLSRAFRNRFLELHVDDIPNIELETILQSRCSLAPSFCRIVISIMTDLQRRRANTSLFAGKHGFITTRDLLRWANRGCHDKKELADQGFMLLGDRLRSEAERHVVKNVIEKHCLTNGEKIDENELYSGRHGTLSEYLEARNLERKQRTHLSESLGRNKVKSDCESNISNEQELKNIVASSVGNVSLTQSLERVFTLVSNSVEKAEPVLLVGGTGCGKTTACQLLAEKLGKQLYILNCHQHTETSDILGGLRPVRGRERSLMIFQEHAKFLFECLNSSEFLVNVRSRSKDLEEWLASTEIPEVNWASASDINLQNAVSLLKNLHGRLPSRSVTQDSEEDFLNKIRNSLDIALENYTNFMSLFRWHDGPLVQAMREGSFILLDEISLAEDAVLERLNSILEPSRTLTLAEKGGDIVEEIVAHPEFRIFATMNPGGDFGKKELSPALRNRFTEIWVPEINDRDDLLCIISEQLKKFVDSAEGETTNHGKMLMEFIEPMLDFVTWFNSQSFSAASSSKHNSKSRKNNIKRGNESASAFFMSLRDILSWVDFIGTTTAPKVDQNGSSRCLAPWSAYMHGAALVVLDGLGLGAGLSDRATALARDASFSFLLKQAPSHLQSELTSITSIKYRNRHTNGKSFSQGATATELDYKNSAFKFGMFSIPLGQNIANLTSEIRKVSSEASSKYALHAPTPSSNLMRVMRSLQLKKPILLEGSPGVGKSSLIATLAAMTGHRLLRINLSEQTDIADLLGADLPVSTAPNGDEEASDEKTAAAPQFQWCDGVFLQALRAGDWVLLDELNLAPQSVLEGLNACLDHRAEVYIPEIDKTYDCPSSFRIFATQNPLQEGGGRKGLPRSFLNRFTKVYVEALKFTDLVFITAHRFPKLAEKDDFVPEAVTAAASASKNNRMSTLQKMIKFNIEMHNRTMRYPEFGRHGAPWDFNLRDVFRWCVLTSGNCRYNASSPPTESPELYYDPLPFIDIVYMQRMRHKIDRDAVISLCKEIFNRAPQVLEFPVVELSTRSVRIGNVLLPRNVIAETELSGGNNSNGQHIDSFSQPPRMLSRPMSHVMTCIEHNWPCLLVGPTSSGKTTSLRWLATATSSTLHEVSLSKATDAADLLGCFEQTYPNTIKKSIFVAVINASKSVDQILLNAKENSSGANESERHLTALKRVEENRWTLQSALSGIQGKHSDESLKFSNSEQIKIIKLALQLLRSMRDALGPIGSEAECIGVMANLANIERRLAKFSLANAESVVSSKKKQEDEQKPFFEWKDGVLVKAVEAGDWLVLEHANLCSATVLDRLNSLMEDDGELLLSECGTSENSEDAEQAHGGRLVKRHPNFRLFLTMDPSFGEISRPMRNRCIEISFLDPIENYLCSVRSHRDSSRSSENCLNTQFSSVRYDCVRLLHSCGVIGFGIASAMFTAHVRAAMRLSHGSATSSYFLSNLSLRHLKRWGLDVSVRVRRGRDVFDAIRSSFKSLYPGVTKQLNGISEEQMLILELYKSSHHIDNSMISTPGVWPNVSALVSSSALLMNNETQRDLALSVNALQFVVAGSLGSYIYNSGLIKKPSEIRAFLSSNAAPNLALPGTLLQIAMSEERGLGVETQRDKQESNLSHYPPKHLHSLFGDISVEKSLPANEAAIEATSVFIRSCSSSNYRQRLHLLKYVCQTMLPQTEDAKIAFCLVNNVPLSEFFTDILLHAEVLATTIYTCSLIQKISQIIVKLDEEYGGSSASLHRTISNVGSRLSPDMTLSAVWESLEPKLLTEVMNRSKHNQNRILATKLKVTWKKLEYFCMAWRLLQNMANQQANEAVFFEKLEQKIQPSFSKENPKYLTKLDMTSTRHNNALELSYLIAKGKRHRGDVHTIITLIFPFLHALYEASRNVFFDADTLELIALTKTVQEVEVLDALRDLIQAREDAFTAFYNLPPYMESVTYNSSHETEQENQNTFEHSEHYLCIVMHLCWLISKTQEVLAFYKEENSCKDMRIVHLEQTVNTLRQQMVENGILNDINTSFLTSGGVSEKTIHSLFTFAPRLWRASGPPCASQCIDVAEARILGRKLSTLEAAEFSCIKNAPQEYDKILTPFGLAQIIDPRVGSSALENTSILKETVDLASVLNTDETSRRELLEAICSVEWANCELLHLQQPSLHNKSSSSQATRQDILAAINRIDIISDQHKSSHKKFREKVARSLSSVTVKDPSLGNDGLDGASEIDDGVFYGAQSVLLSYTDEETGPEQQSNALISLQNRWSEAHLWPAIEIWCLRKEQTLLSEILYIRDSVRLRIRTLTNSKEQTMFHASANQPNCRGLIQPRLNKLLADIREWLDIALSKTCRPVSHFVPYQHLVWAASNLSSVDTAGVASDNFKTHEQQKNEDGHNAAILACKYLEKFLSRTIPEISFLHLRRLWTLPISTERFDPTLTLLGAVHLDEVRRHKHEKRARQEQHLITATTDNSGNHDVIDMHAKPGAAVLLRSIKTESVVSLLRGVGGGGSRTAAETVNKPVSIDDRDPKLSQLHALAAWLGKRDVESKFLDKSKISILWHKFAHIIYAFFYIEEDIPQLISEMAWIGNIFLGSQDLCSFTEVSLKEHYDSLIDCLRNRGSDTRFKSLFTCMVEPTIGELFGYLEMIYNFAKEKKGSQKHGYSRQLMSRQLSLKLARLSILVSLLEYHLIVPSSSVDPSKEPTIRCAALESHCKSQTNKLLMTSMQNTIVTGGPSSPNAKVHLAEIANVNQKIFALRKHIVYRPRNNHAFAMLVKLIHKMSTTLLSVSNIDNLFNALQNLHEDERGAYKQESEWQTSLQLSAERIDSQFGIEYNDVVTPVLAAVYDIKYGISLFRYYAKILNKSQAPEKGTKEDWLQEVTQHMLTLPSLRVAKKFSDGDKSGSRDNGVIVESKNMGLLFSCHSTALERLREISRNGAAATRHMFHVAIDTTHLAVARGLSLPMAVKQTTQNTHHTHESRTRMRTIQVLQSVHRLFSAFVENWNEARNEEERKQAFNASLFRSKTATINQNTDSNSGDIATDSEAETKRKEKEFRALFPDTHAKYKDIFVIDSNDLNANQDASDEAGEGSRNDEDDSETKKFKSTSEDSERLSEAHSALFRLIIESSGQKFQSGKYNNSMLARTVMENSFDVLGHFGSGSKSNTPLVNNELDTPESSGHHVPVQLYLVSRAILVCAGRKASKEEEEDEAREVAEAEALAKAILEAEETLKKESELGEASSNNTNSSPSSAAALALAKLQNKQLLRTKSRLHSRSRSKAKAKTAFHQFHSDSCVREAQKITQPVRALSNRVSTLLQTWPDNTLLVQICRMCTRLLLSPVTSPLSHMLTGIEILLSKCQEWQSVSSSSKTTLADLMKNLSALVIRWRKMELRSWPSLLDSEELKFRTATAKWWPHLYSVVNLTFDASGYELDETVDSSNTAIAAKKWLWMRSEKPAASCSSSSKSKVWVHPQLWESGDKYMLELFENIKMFLHCSKFGDFEARLDLVKGFAEQCRAEAILGFSEFAPARVRYQLSVMLENIYNIYKLMLPAIQHACLSKRNIIEKKLKEQAKLARWDEQTYYALRESSERSHRALFKLVVEFREVLSTPCSPVFESLMVTGGLSSLQADVDANKKASKLVGLWSSEVKCEMNPGQNKASTKKEQNSKTWFHLSAPHLNSEPSSIIVLNELVGTPDVYLRAQTALRAEKFTRRLLTPLGSYQNQAGHLEESPQQKPTRLSWLSDNCVSQLESISTLIIRRLSRLSGVLGEDQRKPTKMAKKLALVRLLEVLKEEHFTHAMARVPPSMSYLHSICTVPVPKMSTSYSNVKTEEDRGGHIQEESSIFMNMSVDCKKAVCTTWDQADKYHYRCILQLQNLRQQVVAGAVSSDINTKETRVMHGISENLLLESLRTRQSMANALESFEEMSLLVKQIERWRLTIENLDAKPSSHNEEMESLYLFKELSDRQSLLLHLKAILEDIAQVEDTVSRAVETDTSKESSSNRLSCSKEIDVMMKEIQQCLLSLYPHTEMIPGPEARLSLDKTKLSLERVDANLCSIIKSLSSVSSENLPMPVHPFQKMRDYISESGCLKSFCQPSNVKDNSQINDQAEGAVSTFVSARNALLERSLLQIQKIRKKMDEVYEKYEKSSIPVSTKNNVHAYSDPKARSTDEEEKTVPLATCCKASNGLIAELNLPLMAKAARTVISALSQVISSVSSPDTNISVPCMKLALNATCVTQYCLNLAQTVIVNTIAVQKSFGKLSYILIRLFRNLFADGFCDSGKSSAGDDSGEDDAEDEDMEMGEGTGIGEGQGQNDVSDQIENEEQVLGLQNDEDKEDAAPPDNKSEPRDADDGVEMTNDFEGEMTDIKENDDDNDEHKDDNDEEEEELDREMGEMEDDEENVVDEKMWGDDSDDDDDDDKNQPDDNEKFEKDSAMKGESLEDETRTKEDDEDNKGTGKDDKREQEEDPHNQSEDNNEDDDAGKSNEEQIDEINEDKEEDYEEQHTNAPVREQDEMAGSDNEDKEDEDLDLDLEMAEKEQDEGEDPMGGENADDMDKEEQDSINLDEPEREANPETDSSDEGQKADAMELDENEAEANDDDEESENRDDEQLEKPVDDVDDGMGASAVAVGNDGNQGVHGDDEEEDADEADAENKNTDQKEESSLDQLEEQEQTDAEDANENEKKSASGLDSKQDLGGDQNDNGELRPQELPQNNESNKAEQKQQKQPRRESINPYRRPGDARKEWHRRLNIVEDEKDEAEKNEDQQNPEQSQQDSQQPNNESQYMFDDERNKQDAEDGEQALARAREDQEEDEGVGDSVEDEENAEGEDMSNLMDEDAKVDPNADKDEDEQAKEDHSDVKSKNSSFVPSDVMKMQEKDQSMDIDGEEDKDVEDDVDMHRHDDTEDAPDEDVNIQGDIDGAGDGDEEVKKSNLSSDEEQDIDEGSDGEEMQLELTAADLAASREAITKMLSLRSANDIERAHAIWSRIDSITASGSQRLCEQLRLILEPTLATKLKGDFRTGKRINMRKIIPYIASSYRKDKIWLRRKKPSKRQYQIMIAVDDSESMQPRDPSASALDSAVAAGTGTDSVHFTNARLGAGSVALEALALIGNALTRLEVGEIAVASFGTDCRMLHPFSKPFTADAGAEVVSSFTFSQKETDMVKMVDWTAQALQIARDSAGYGASEHVQLVFVVTDALGCNPKSLDRIRKLTREASTKDCMFVLLIIDTAEKPIIEMQRVTYENGKPKLKHYLDDIPFDYYVTVRDITALPEVLGDSLRQWWESVNSSN